MSGEIIKTRFFILSMLLIFCNGVKGRGIIRRLRRQALPFKCPVECPSGVYQPICSRGISYANLCTLQQQICTGNTAREIYNDVEACPKYEKDEDKEGASVEAIDKNGVIFRNLIEPSEVKKTKQSNPAIVTDLRHDSTKSTRRHSLKKNGRFLSMGQGISASTLSSSLDDIRQIVADDNDANDSVEDCSNQKITLNPVLILRFEFSGFCDVKPLICESYLREMKS